MKIPVNLEDYFQKTLENKCFMGSHPKYKGYEHFNNEKLYYFYFDEVVYLKEDDKMYVLTEEDIPSFMRIKTMREEINEKIKDYKETMLITHKELLKIPNWIRKIYKISIPDWLIYNYNYK